MALIGFHCLSRVINVLHFSNLFLYSSIFNFALMLIRMKCQTFYLNLKSNLKFNYPFFFNKNRNLFFQ